MPFSTVNSKMIQVYCSLCRTTLRPKKFINTLYGTNVTNPMFQRANEFYATHHSWYMIRSNCCPECMSRMSEDNFHLSHPFICSTNQDVKALYSAYGFHYNARKRISS